jgi:phosphomethylpyrimidine synthase
MQYKIKNRLRSISPQPCGADVPTVVIASIGTSQKGDDFEDEIRKAHRAQQVGANVVTDHSFYGDIPRYQRMLVDNLDIPVSAVSNYEWAAQVRESGKGWSDVDGRQAIDILAQQVARGLDMITVHASFERRHLELVRESQRHIPMTSKGGGIISSYMRATGEENPYYEFYDDVLSILSAHDAVLSLGTSFRPASVCDRLDDLFFTELISMRGLVERALRREVKVMVEGIGHAALRDIPCYVAISQQLCYGVPYRILPMATDIALGYDHISGAIATAVAVMSGANAVTCVTRAEHIGLPSLADLEESIIATRIACHSAQLGGIIDYGRDMQMSKTRWAHGCKGDWSCAIYPEGAAEALRRYGRLADQHIQCSMCGAYCGIAAGLATTKVKDKDNEAKAIGLGREE